MRTWPGLLVGFADRARSGPVPISADRPAHRRPRAEPLSASFNVIGNDSAAQESTLCCRSRTLQAGREAARGLSR
jgi:hypothetical protein